MRSGHHALCDQERPALWEPCRTPAEFPELKAPMSKTNTAAEQHSRGACWDLPLSSQILWCWTFVLLRDGRRQPPFRVTGQRGATLEHWAPPPAAVRSGHVPSRWVPPAPSATRACLAPTWPRGADGRPQGGSTQGAV